MALPDDVAAVVAGFAPDRVLEVGSGERFDVARAVADATGAEVRVSDRDAPDPPDPLVGVALDLTEVPAPSGADVVVAVRLPPELWSRAEAVADESEAPLVLCPLAEETPPHGYRLARPGVYVRRPRTAP